jgi:putative ATP-binding cassette transporter
VKLLSFLVKHSPWLFSLAVLSGLASGFASVGLMALIIKVLGRLDRQSPQIVWVFVGVTAVVLVSNVTSSLLLLRLSTRAVFQMRIHLCNQILRSPLRLVEHHGPSRLMAVLTEDVLAVSDTLAQVPLLCINTAVTAACLSYLFWLSWQLALGSLSFFAVGVFTYELIERRTRPYLAEGREKWDALIGLYQALILGNKELKLHCSRRQAFFAEAVEPTAKAMQKLSFGWHSIYALAAGYGQILYFVAIGVVLFAAPRFRTFDSAVLAGFTLLFIYMNGPISFIIRALPSFQRASVSLAKIESLGLSLLADRFSDIQSAISVRSQAFGGIDVVGLTYMYRQEDDDRPFTLGPIDLTFRPGELTFITGGNGSGKSTFARLLTGLYVPESGMIVIDGEPVTDKNRDQYRQRFSVVFADFYLFDALFGLLRKDSYPQVVEYLNKLRLTHKVKVVDGRFSTTNLSQGQRKRLALLTAFLEDRDIYLFDEWAADQDPSFKDVFYHQLLPELKAKGKTVLAISHDEHFYHVADRIIKFEDGMVIHDGANPQAGGRGERSFQPDAPADASAVAGWK